MSTQLLISMLRKGSTGQEILGILDAITDTTDHFDHVHCYDSLDNIVTISKLEHNRMAIAGGYAEPTLDEIAF